MRAFSCRFWIFVATALGLVVLAAPTLWGQQGPEGKTQTPSDVESSWFIKTSSPRATMQSTLRWIEEAGAALVAYRRKRTQENFSRIRELSSMLPDLIDMKGVPEALRHEVAVDTVSALADIFGRIELPPLKDIPDVDAVGLDESGSKWRIPNTPILILRIDEGEREGEFLFTERTTRVAPRFAKHIDALPQRSDIVIESWRRAAPEVSGPLIPSSVVAAIPYEFQTLWLGTPIWKVVVVLVAVIAFLSAIYAFHRLTAPKGDMFRLGNLSRGLLTPIALFMGFLGLDQVVPFQVNVAGDFAQLYSFASTVFTYFAIVWMFWLISLAVFELLILSPRIPDESLDANLLRLLARLIGVVGSVIILAFGAQALGFPLFSVLAGLGVGGLAVALALRPTLENLIGGVALYLDKPVRVGDFCSFGSQMGTIESIGVRSTQVRALDRTLISIPNSHFADMEISNWERCDKMLIDVTIGLRYETPPDRIRFVLVSLREMLHAHPKIDADTVRVRMTGFGDSSKDAQIRVYALTNDWNEFFAIREDIVFRVDDIVTKSGTGFAFPSRTLYLGKDGGLDAESGSNSERIVEDWRRRGILPFPTMPTERIEALAGTLDYPPRGSSSSTSSTTPVEAAASEPLSIEPKDQGADEVDKP